MFCTNCGNPLPDDAKFCPSCGTPVTPLLTTCSQCGAQRDSDAKFCAECGNAHGVGGEAPSRNLRNVWQELEANINNNWGSYLDIEPDVFGELSITEWKNLQSLLQQKAFNFLGLRSLEDYNFWIAQANSSSFTALDTIESIDEALESFISSLDPSTDVEALIAAHGTKSQLPYGSPHSGQSFYWPAAVTSVESELKMLSERLRVGDNDNLIGPSFDPYLGVIDLLSDFGRSLLVPFLGTTPSEIDLLKHWGPQPTGMRLDMASVLVAAFHNERIGPYRNMLVNPRMVFLLLDDNNYSQPWWMEMGLWYSCADDWKEISKLDFGKLRIDVIADLLEDFLKTGQTTAGAEAHLQDKEMFSDLLNFLRKQI